MDRILHCGDVIHLSKENPSLKNLRISTKWELKYGVDVDLDASMLILDENEKLLKKDGIVYYNNLKLYGQIIQHSGDVIRPRAEDDETISINLLKLPFDVKIIPIFITIFNMEGSTKRTFESVKDISIKLSDADTNKALCCFYLTDASIGTAVEMGRLYNNYGEWRFNVLGEVITTAHNGLQGVIDKYNCNIIIDKNRQKTMTMITPIRNRIVKARWKTRQRIFY